MADFTDYIPGTLETGAGIAELLSGNPMGIPMSIAGIQNLAGTAKKSQAAKNAPPLQDPNMIRFLGEIDRQRKTFESGSAYGSEIRELKNQQSATNEGVLRATGGNTGAAVAALERVGINTGMTYGKIAGEGQARQDEYTQMYGSLLNNISNRKLNIQEQQYQQKFGEGQQNQIAGLQQGLNAAALTNNPQMLDALKKLLASKQGASPTSNGSLVQNVSPNTTPALVGDLNTAPSDISNPYGDTSLANLLSNITMGA